MKIVIELKLADPIDALHYRDQIVFDAEDLMRVGNRIVLNRESEDGKRRSWAIMKILQVNP